MDLDAYILAGGKSSRFGSDKALFPIEGEAMILRVHRALSDAQFNNITVVGREEIRSLSGIHCIPDLLPNLGPLGAFHSICSQEKSKSFFTISCDMPFVEASIIQTFLEKTKGMDNCAVEIEGRPQPLFAKYSRNIAKQVNELIIAEELSMSALLQRIDIKLIDAKLLCDEPKKAFANINTQQELTKWLKK